MNPNLKEQTQIHLSCADTSVEFFTVARCCEYLLTPTLRLIWRVFSQVAIGTEKVQGLGATCRAMQTFYAKIYAFERPGLDAASQPNQMREFVDGFDIREDLSPVMPWMGIASPDSKRNPVWAFVFAVCLESVMECGRR